MKRAHGTLYERASEQVQRVIDNLDERTSIDLSDANLDDADVRALAEALATNTSVTSINMHDNPNVGVVSARALARALMTNSSVTSLNLSATGIGVAGVRALTLALMTNTSLEKLYLEYNGLGDEGMLALVAGLNMHLTTIDVERNNIRDVGARALARALATKSTRVTSINLADNWIGDDVAPALAAAVAANPNVTHLLLSDNLIELASERSISALVVRNIGAALSRTLILLSRADSPVMRLAHAEYERVVRDATEPIIREMRYHDNADANEAALRRRVDAHLAEMQRRRLLHYVPRHEATRTLARMLLSSTIA